MQLLSVWTCDPPFVGEVSYRHFQKKNIYFHFQEGKMVMGNLELSLGANATLYWRIWGGERETYKKVCVLGLC